MIPTSYIMKISWFWAKLWAVIETSVMGKEDWFKNWDLADRIGMHQFWHSKSSVTLVLNAYMNVFDISLYFSSLKHFRKINFYFFFSHFFFNPENVESKKRRKKCGDARNKRSINAFESRYECFTILMEIFNSGQLFGKTHNIKTRYDILYMKFDARIRAANRARAQNFGEFFQKVCACAGCARDARALAWKSCAIALWKKHDFLLEKFNVLRIIISEL